MNMQRIDIAHRNGVAHVRLNRPEARNAVDLAMCEALLEAFAGIDDNETVRVVVLDAAGPAFCAGADLKERDGKDAAWVKRRRQASFAAYAAVEACAVPVVALVHGAAVGSGGELALACDFIIAAETATFRFPEPQWSTVGATQRLQRAIGARNAKELLFTGRTMPAAEALDRGLVAQIFPAEELEAAGVAIADAIAAASPLAMRLTKRALDLGGETSLANGIKIEMSAIDRNLADGEWKKGIEAFLERDKKAWKPRP